MTITVLGTSYEGLAISVGLAKLGHRVFTIDTDPGRVRKLQRGIQIDDDHELSKQMKLVLREGSLRFTTEPESCLTEAEIVIIADIAGGKNGVSRTNILQKVECLSGATASFSTILVTAKLPIGSCQILQEWLDEALHTNTVNVVACPVFFEKPHGLQGFLNPSRIVLGYKKEASRRVVDEVFARLLANDPPVSHVSWEVAENASMEIGLASSIPESVKSLKNKAKEAVPG